MHTIAYHEYLDRVYGCWIGKCVGGTLGAPYEGAKELFHFDFDPALIESMLPNDDLDLQVLWLSVLEEKGIRFRSEDLAEAFLNRCPYAPGEYAVFKKNYTRGIHPPDSGRFNNRYYIEGMGCPIRAEIWGCIAPGNPELAAGCAAKDGVLDHAGNSVFAEQFLAALEAAAFFESDVEKLIAVGLEQIPADSRVAGLIRDVRDWCRADSDWRLVRGRILRKYGHPDCTNMFQNIGITLMSLLKGRMDFVETMMIALNSGFDTDCTCGIAGAVLGIIRGGEDLSRSYGLSDPGFVLGVDAPRRSNRILDLAEDTCRMGLHFLQMNPSTRITEAPAPPQIALPAIPPVSIRVEYDGPPAIGIGDRRKVRIVFENSTGAPISGTAMLQVPQGWESSESSAHVQIPAGETEAWEVEISVPESLQVLQETNLCRVELETAGGVISHQFGLIGAAVWEIFGPFWQNNADMSGLQPRESFYKYISGADKNDYADQVRTYHLNTRVDLDREYMSMDELLNHGSSDDAAKEPRLFNSYEDRFSVNDLVGFQGPCAIYLVRRLLSPEDRKLGIHIGHTDAYQLWINGELVSRRDNVDWWTAENAHILDFPIRKGTNIIVLKLIRRSASADFSLIFAKGGPCTAHMTDFASLSPSRSSF